jgi:hypothetical protein
MVGRLGAGSSDASNPVVVVVVLTIGRGAVGEAGDGGSTLPCESRSSWAAFDRTSATSSFLVETSG